MFANNDVLYMYLLAIILTLILTPTLRNSFFFPSKKGLKLISLRIKRDYNKLSCSFQISTSVSKKNLLLYRIDELYNKFLCRIKNVNLSIKKRQGEL